MCRQSKIHAMELSGDSIAGEHAIFVINEEEIETTQTVLDEVDTTSHDSSFNNANIQSLMLPDTTTSEEEFKKITECAEAIVQLEKIVHEENNAKRRKTLPSGCKITECFDEDVESLSTSNEQVTTLQENYKTSKFTCYYCPKTFAYPGNRRKHMRIHHNEEYMMRRKESNIKCMECTTRFTNVIQLRSHLQCLHNYNMSMEELSFPDINAFRKWKFETERLTLSSYTRTHGLKRTPAGIAHFYHCHRSGKFLPKVKQRKRVPRSYGTCKMGIICTASIICVETQHGIQVKYYPHHYGHGKETTLITLSEEEQKAITDSTSKGVSYEHVINEMQESQSALDTYQLNVLRKRDFRIIDKACRSEDFNLEISEVDGVDRWVSSCCKMENSPILFYQKGVCEKNVGVEIKKWKNILLMIMTESQKHILLTSSKQVICLDVSLRLKKGRCYLTSLLVIDETGAPFPVAFCISNKVDKEVMSLFFNSIIEETGPLSVEYFMSQSEPAYHEAWREVMNDSSKWLWNMWNVETRLRSHLKLLRGNPSKKAQVCKTMKKLMDCHNQVVFSHMYDDFVQNLSEDISCQNLASFLKEKYGQTPEMWAYCYRKDISFATNIKLEMIHRTLGYCCRAGRKSRLDKFLFVLMKLLRYKTLQRFSFLTDKNINLAIDTIDGYHKLGLEIPPEYITAVSDKIWLVLTDSEDEHFYVTLEHESCPEHCSLKCSECKTCVHTYSCTCTGNLINANFCIHIHAVVWNFVPPPLPAPVAPEDDLDELEVIPGSFDNPGLLHQLLEASREMCKKIKNVKKDIKEDSLQAALKRIRECIDIFDGKSVELPSPLMPSSTMLIINPFVGCNGFQPLTTVPTQMAPASSFSILGSLQPLLPAKRS